MFWNYSLLSLWMLTRSNKQQVIKFYVRLPQGLALQILPQMFRRCEFSASGKGFLLTSEINAVLHIMDPALHFPMSQGDFLNQTLNFHTLPRYSTRQLCPRRMVFQRATNKRIKPGSNLVMSLHLLQQVSALKVPAGPVLFQLLPSQPGFHNSGQVQRHRAPLCCQQATGQCRVSPGFKKK